MTYPPEQLRYLLALHRIKGLGANKIVEILKYYPDLKDTFNSSDECLVTKGKADWWGVDQDLKWALQDNCHIVTLHCESYPALLKEIQGAPPILFVKGNLECLSHPQIAIVGTRNPTAVGNQLANHFSQHFAACGWVVTSGLAVGIDSSAHMGALLSEGKSIAVLGNGLDVIYPLSNQNLAQEISENGALVSEFPIGTPALPAHFPRRNRIISGLSLGILVVEATLKSGSLITANFALEQGREVFAMPGSIHNPQARGCHFLIKNGAKLVETAEDVLEELRSLIKYLSREATPTIKQLPLTGLGPQLKRLLNYIGYESTPIDLVVMKSGLTTALVSSMLLELELMGHIKLVPGGYARLVTF